MINRRFLNYKLYSSFKRDLNGGQISKDAIVFIQDESHPCIWTHNKEYLCNVGKSSLTGNKLIFDDGFGNSVFSIEQNNGDITLTDSDGNSSSVSYILKSTFDQTVRDLYRAIRDVDDSQRNIIVDDQISLLSTNPVQNRIIALALNTKVDEGDLENYATKGYVDGKLQNIQLSEYVTDSELEGYLNYKQDVLTPGNGISIVNNTISCTLDTAVFVIVEELPSNPDPNKIYLLYTAEGNSYTYYEYKWDGTEWHNNGERNPNINLSEYLKTSTAAQLYQPIGNYVIASQLSNYATTSDLSNLQSTIDSVYQKKGDYASKDYVARAIEYVQGVIDRKYVLKTDVYSPADYSNWSTETPTPLDIPTEGGDNSSAYSHIFLEQDQYDQLTSYDANTIYFIYEESEDQPSGSWEFGDSFPIILT